MLLALGDHPYSYYQFLRWITCISAFSLAYLAYGNERNEWMWVFVIIGILFNPIAPFYLDQETWQFYNFAVAFTYFISIFKFKVSNSHAR
jgi:hypothetical protein